MFELRWKTTQYYATEINGNCCEHVIKGQLPSHVKKERTLQYRTKTKMPANRHNLGAYDHAYNAQALDWGEWMDVPEEIIHE